MHKLFRSLLAVGALTAFAACGDDVSITEPPAPGVTISGAPTTAIKVGDVVQLSANQPVNWTSSASNVASVDGTGRVTALAAGVASITATSQEDATKSASVTITITGSIAPTVSIASITAGAPAVPVNPANVAGLVNVNVNMDPGDFTVQRLELLVDGQVVDQQNFTSAVQAAVAVDGEPANQAQVITFVLNTADFDPSNGVAAYPNGTHAISARVVVTGGGSSGAASPAQQLTFNNVGGFVFTVSNDNGDDAASAVNPNTGITWIGGSVTLNVVGVSYTGDSYSSVTVGGGFLGKNPFPITLTNNAGSVTFAEGTAWAAGNTGLGAYQSGATENIAVAASVLGGAAGPTNTLNGTNDIPAFPQLLVDNVAPAAPTVGNMPIWLNASFDFDTTSTALTGVTDAGVSGITTTFYYIDGALPGAANACNTTGMTEIASASELAETLVSSAYRGRVVIEDALGNQRCADLMPGGVAQGQFGADFTPPADPTFAGPANDTTFITTGAADAATFTFSNLQDNASGFGTYPVLATLRRFNANGTTTCLIGSPASSCANKGDTTATVSVTANSGTEGYYLFSGQVQDSALNANATLFDRRLLVDATPAAVVGILSMPSLIEGQGSATFNGQVTDNIDLAQYYGLLLYAGAPDIRTAPVALGTYGEDVLTKSADVSLTLTGAMRCLALAPGGTPGAPQKLAAIDLRVQDFAQMNDDVSSGIGGGVQVIPPAAVEDCGTIADVTDWADSLPAAAVDISRDGQTNNTATTVDLVARALVPLNVTNNPFQRVEFYRVNALGELVLIGTGTAALTQTVTERIWTYTMTWDPGADVPNGAVTIRAIGVTADGDGVLTDGQNNITIVN